MGRNRQDQGDKPAPIDRFSWDGEGLKIVHDPRAERLKREKARRERADGEDSIQFRRRDET